MEMTDEGKQKLHDKLQDLGVRIVSKAKRKCPVDTGRLRSSLTFDVDKSSDILIVGTNVEYSKYVEFGTEKMRPQPYLRPAIKQVLQDGA